MTGPRVGIVGPLLGHHPGWVVSQGERLGEHLAADGLTVRTTSGRIGRLARAIDTVRTVRSWRGQVDVVVAMVFSGPAFAVTSLATRAARAEGLPVVLWLHGGNLPAFARRHPRWVAAVRDRAQAVVAPSEYLLETLGRPDDRDRFVARPAVIPNIVDAAVGPFTPRATLRPRLLWMRTYHPLYRPEWAVDVLGRLVDRFPDAALTMAGQDKGGLAAVQVAAHSAGLDDRVVFAGFLDETGKAEAFASHDLFLNTTATDNAPVSLLEAAAHGLPIVSTAVGGIAHLFADREAALLADDPEGLSNAVAELLTDHELAVRLSATAYERAAACTWDRVGPSWRQLLESVARERVDG